MKQMTLREHQKVMLEILTYFDKICRENDVKYTLIGGSLIGAIRHKGFIPWDDDIDVGLDRKNYKKIIEILEKREGRYQLLAEGHGGEQFSFKKLIDTKTKVIEPARLNNNDEYGVFVDIFEFHKIPDEQKRRQKHIKKLKLLVSILSRKKTDFKNETVKQNTLRIMKNMLSRMLGYKRIQKMFEKEISKYENCNGKYTVSNWPLYGIEEETHRREDFSEFIDWTFEGKTVMITKYYDQMLSKTYGNYMKLPPVEERKNKHKLIAYWK